MQATVQSTDLYLVPVLTGQAYLVGELELDQWLELYVNSNTFLRAGD